MSSTLPEFEGLRVCVVGDLIADRYLVAEPSRLSREAPVMVLRHREERLGAGGAANVARNLHALGANVEVMGIVGDDANGRELLRVLGEEGIESHGVECIAERKTPTKTRILAAEPRRSLQQVLRIDEEPEGPPDSAARERLLNRLRERLVQFDAVILSDYEYGALDAAIGKLTREAAEAGKVCVLDPRQNLDDYRGLTALTPNVGELARFTGHSEERLDDVATLRAAAGTLLERSQAKWLLVTRGNLGMALFGRDNPEGVFIEASGSGDVTDVSGAGDTAAAVFALALAAGCEGPRAMELANVASGVVVMENGAATCSQAELAAALRSETRTAGERA